MNNNEKVFKLLGWKYLRHPHNKEAGWWKLPNGNTRTSVPNVSNDFELCRKDIIPEIRGIRNMNGGFTYSVGPYIENSGDHERHFMQFEWCHEDFGSFTAEIIDDKIPAALVEAAIKVLEAKDEQYAKSDLPNKIGE